MARIIVARVPEVPLEPHAVPCPQGDHRPRLGEEEETVETVHRTTFELSADLPRKMNVIITTRIVLVGVRNVIGLAPKMIV